MPSLEETDPALLDALAILMHNYGPKGVYDTCAQMINAMKADQEAQVGV